MSAVKAYLGQELEHTRYTVRIDLQQRTGLNQDFVGAHPTGHQLVPF